MTGHLIFLLIVAAGAYGLGIIPGHKLGRRSRRFDYRDGYLEGVKAEAARWEKVTGTGFGRLQAWRTGRGPDPFANLAAATEVLPSKEALFAKAAAQGYTGEQPAVPSAAYLDQMAAAWNAAHSRAPVVADITSAARWRTPGMGEVPVIDGRVVTGSDRHSDDLMDAGGAWHGPGAWDRAAALPDYAAAALGGHRTVDELVDSIVMRAVGR